MKLRYNVEDRPPFGKMVIFALQQLLAILAATIAVPAIVGNGMTASAAMFGAGAGTLIYFLSVAVFFVFLTVISFEKRRHQA